MQTSSRPANRLILHESICELREMARRERALMPSHAPERQFSLGVDAAAEDVLHPERAGARPEDWLARQSLPFREGYLRTEILLATLATAAEPPLVLRPPTYDLVRP
jgi:hypothetical protein